MCRYSKLRQATPQGPSQTALAKVLWLLLVSCLFTACSRSPACGPFCYLFPGGTRRRGRSSKAAGPGRVPPFGPGGWDASACLPLVCGACPGCPACPWNPGLFPQRAAARPSGPGRQRRLAFYCGTCLKGRIGVSARSALAASACARMSMGPKHATLAIGGKIEQPDERVGGDGTRGRVCFPRRVGELLRAGPDLHYRHLAGEISRHRLAVARGHLEGELTDLSPPTHPRRCERPPSRLDPPSSAQMIDAS
jgi:hypothetical protein